MRNSLSIIQSEQQPVHTAEWLLAKVESSPFFPSTQYVALIADQLLMLEYKVDVMYCPDTFTIPTPPHRYGAQYRLLPTPTNPALDTVHRIIKFFVSSDKIPDTDRGYWHNRLAGMLDSINRTQNTAVQC